VSLLFLHDSSLQKRLLITAHISSSLHKNVHDCMLKQTLPFIRLHNLHIFALNRSCHFQKVLFQSDGVWGMRSRPITDYTLQ